VEQRFDFLRLEPSLAKYAAVNIVSVGGSGDE
jgi:hypothetical protein